MSSTRSSRTWISSPHIASHNGHVRRCTCRPDALVSVAVIAAPRVRRAGENLTQGARAAVLVRCSKRPGDRSLAACGGEAIREALEEPRGNREGNREEEPATHEAVSYPRTCLRNQRPAY